MPALRSAVRLGFGLSLVALLVPAVASPAAAAPDPVWGCTFTLVPVRDGFLVTMTGHAVVFGDDPVTGLPLPALPVTVGCSAGNVAAYSPPGAGVAVLPPTVAVATAPVMGCEWVWALLPDGTWIHYQKCAPLNG